jgi:hypothetical protein
MGQKCALERWPAMNHKVAGHSWWGAAIGGSFIENVNHLGYPAVLMAYTALDVIDADQPESPGLFQLLGMRTLVNHHQWIMRQGCVWFATYLTRRK